MNLFRSLFGPKAPPETVESLKAELKRVEYVIRNGYKKDLPKLEKEKAEIEEKLKKLQQTPSAA